MAKERNTLVSGIAQPEDKEVEATLRPQKLKDFIGQDKIKEQLDIFIQAAKKRGEALDHVLFSGPPGLGKTTLSNIIASELEVDIKSTTGPVLEKAGDLAGLLTNLSARDILFIDEIHRINSTVEEYLYTAMEDYFLDIVIGTGPSARTIKLSLNPFTLIGATTRTGLITPPMRSRFGVIIRLNYYSAEELSIIVNRSAKILNIPIDQKGALEIAKRSRGTPRIANRLLKRVRDYAEIKGEGKIDYETACKALDMLDVDSNGLDEMDKAIMFSLIENYGGGPVGLKTLAVAVGEESDTIEEVYEPYLVQQGFIQRTPRGRKATPKAFEYFKMRYSRLKQRGIFE